jgi:hypothetical protein
MLWFLVGFLLSRLISALRKGFPFMCTAVALFLGITYKWEGADITADIIQLSMPERIAKSQVSLTHYRL